MSWIRRKVCVWLLRIGGHAVAGAIRLIASSYRSVLLVGHTI
jgi:hypothetical protein